MADKGIDEESKRAFLACTVCMDSRDCSRGFSSMAIASFHS
jgi:hypothetical protein